MFEICEANHSFIAILLVFDRGFVACMSLNNIACISYKRLNPGFTQIELHICVFVHFTHFRTYIRTSIRRT